MADVLIDFKDAKGNQIDCEYFYFESFDDTQELLEAIEKTAKDISKQNPESAPIFYHFNILDELPEVFNRDYTGSLESNFDKIYKYLDAVNDAKLSDDEIEALTDYAAHNGHDLEDAADFMRSFESAKYGKYDDEADFGQSLYESIYGEVTGELSNFINWQGYGESLLNTDYYKTENDYYFRVN